MKAFFLLGMIILALLASCAGKQAATETTPVAKQPSVPVQSFGEPDGVLDCPRGVVDETYARCGLYVDQNKDDVCDHSQ